MSNPIQEQPIKPKEPYLEIPVMTYMSVSVIIIVFGVLLILAIHDNLFSSNTKLSHLQLEKIYNLFFLVIPVCLFILIWYHWKMEDYKTALREYDYNIQKFNDSQPRHITKTVYKAIGDGDFVESITVVDDVPVSSVIIVNPELYLIPNQ